jgi:hypothetical protein
VLVTTGAAGTMTRKEAMAAWRAWLAFWYAACWAAVVLVITQLKSHVKGRQTRALLSY